MGINFIEGGWPGSNPAMPSFSRSQGLKLKNAEIVVFGRHPPPISVTEEDSNLLITARDRVLNMPGLVGKTSDLQVTQVLETTLEET